MNTCAECIHAEMCRLMPLPKTSEPQENKEVEKEVNTVLDKILNEINEYKSRKIFGIGAADLEKGKETALDYVIAIINQYKAESEDIS